MNLNMEHFKPFKISDIFEIYNGKGITTEEIECNSGNLIVVQSGEENNGCLGKIDKEYCIEMGYTMSELPCLTVARTGSAGFVSYQKKGCVVGDSAKILSLKEKEHINDNVMIFLQTILLANKYKYTYGRKVTKDKYSNDIIMLPTTSQGSPDYNFMNNYIKSLKSKPLTTSNKAGSSLILNIEEWKPHSINDIFSKVKIPKFSAVPESEGKYRFVSSTSYNNGVVKKVDELPIDGVCITVSTNGSCFDCFFHDKPIVVSNDVEVLYSNHLNKYTAMFICTVMNKEKYKWSYGRKPKNNKVYETIINLPTTKEGKPDWAYMEEYIKSLPYGDRL